MQALDQVVDWVSRRLLRSATVVACEEVAPTFRRVDLATEPADWAPGQKLQAQLSGTSFRTFTPFDWTEDGVSLLVHTHEGESPATAWVDDLGPGEPVRLFGPRKSLDLSSAVAPVVVGDETSFALALAWARFGPTPASAALFEVTDPAASRTALGDLAATLVDRQPDDGHHPALAEAVLAAVDGHPDSTLVLTGKAQTIRAVRGALKDAGRSPAVRVKAYWDPNRSAMD